MAAKEKEEKGTSSSPKKKDKKSEKREEKEKDEAEVDGGGRLETIKFIATVGLCVALVGVYVQYKIGDGATSSVGEKVTSSGSNKLLNLFEKDFNLTRAQSVTMGKLFKSEPRILLLFYDPETHPGLTLITTCLLKQMEKINNDIEQEQPAQLDSFILQADSLSFPAKDKKLMTRFLLKQWRENALHINNPREVPEEALGNFLDIFTKIAQNRVMPPEGEKRNLNHLITLHFPMNPSKLCSTQVLTGLHKKAIEHMQYAELPYPTYVMHCAKAQWLNQIITANPDEYKGLVTEFNAMWKEISKNFVYLDYYQIVLPSHCVPRKKKKMEYEEITV